MTSDEVRNSSDYRTTQTAQRNMDMNYEDHILTKVDGTYDYYSLSFDGMVLGLDKSYGVEPKIGQIIRVYGRFGSQVYGMDLDGSYIYYQTIAEREAERTEWLEKYRLEQEEIERKCNEEYAAKLKENPHAFDWEHEGVSEKSATALNALMFHPDPESDFPQTYAGQAWRCVFRYWVATDKDHDLLDGLGAFDNVPGADVSGLGLSGFMEGWARNAVRQMRYKLPKGNPAIVEIGGDFELDAVPARGNINADLKAILGVTQ